MPSRSPAPGARAARHLHDVGAQLRARRLALGVTATRTAEAAGLSRVTLHRIERGEPSVTVGAVASVAAALGLELQLAPPPSPSAEVTSLEEVVVREWPELRRLGWQLAEDTVLSARDAFQLYERNWRHVDEAAMSARERGLVRSLADRFGGSLLDETSDG